MDGFSASSLDGNSHVQVKQYLEPQGMKYFHGDENSHKGFIFHSPKNLIPVDFIQFDKKGKKESYITTIVLNQEEYENKIESLKVIKDGVRVNISGKEYEINDREDVTKDILNKNLKNSLTVKEGSLTKNNREEYTYTVETYNPKVQYAFYLFRDGKKIYTKEYSKDNFITFKPEKRGKYTCRYFIQSEGEEEGIDKKISDSFDERVEIK